MLQRFPIFPSLPAHDLERALRWYEDKLGLKPVQQLPPLAVLVSGGAPFMLYQTPSAGTARNTLAAWVVDDLGSVMEQLRQKGVVFEEYAMGDSGPTTENGVARSPDGSAAAWFADSEGNILSLIQLGPGIEIVPTPAS